VSPREVRIQELLAKARLELDEEGVRAAFWTLSDALNQCTSAADVRALLVVLSSVREQATHAYILRSRALAEAALDLVPAFEAAERPGAQRNVGGLPSFGPFDRIFRHDDRAVERYGYLYAFNPANEAQGNIDLVLDILGESPAQIWLNAVLLFDNWRPRAVAAVAYVLDGGVRLDPASLWRVMSVAQMNVGYLVVAALYSDPHFLDNADFRLLETSGRGRGYEELVASLNSARRLEPSFDEHLRRRFSESELDRIFDCGEGSRSGGWATAMKERLRERGLDLRPRFAT
jgi:hypothetical protein